MKGKAIILLEKKLYRTLPDFGVDEEFLNRMQEEKKKLTIKSDKVKNIKN